MKKCFLLTLVFIPAIFFSKIIGTENKNIATNFLNNDPNVALKAPKNLKDNVEKFLEKEKYSSHWSFEKDFNIFYHENILDVKVVNNSEINVEDKNHDIISLNYQPDGTVYLNKNLTDKLRFLDDNLNTFAPEGKFLKFEFSDAIFDPSKGTMYFDGTGLRENGGAYNFKGELTKNNWLENYKETVISSRRPANNTLAWVLFGVLVLIIVVLGVLTCGYGDLLVGIFDTGMVAIADQLTGVTIETEIEASEGGERVIAGEGIAGVNFETEGAVGGIENENLENGLNYLKNDKSEIYKWDQSNPCSWSKNPIVQYFRGTWRQEPNAVEPNVQRIVDQTTYRLPNRYLPSNPIWEYMRYTETKFGKDGLQKIIDTGAINGQDSFQYIGRTFYHGIDPLGDTYLENNVIFNYPSSFFLHVPEAKYIDADKRLRQILLEKVGGKRKIEPKSIDKGWHKFEDWINKEEGNDKKFDNSLNFYDSHEKNPYLTDFNGEFTHHPNYDTYPLDHELIFFSHYY